MERIEEKKIYTVNMEDGALKKETIVFNNKYITSYVDAIRHVQIPNDCNNFEICEKIITNGSIKTVSKKNFLITNKRDFPNLMAEIENKTKILIPINYLTNNGYVMPAALKEDPNRHKNRTVISREPSRHFVKFYFYPSIITDDRLACEFDNYLNLELDVTSNDLEDILIPNMDRFVDMFMLKFNRTRSVKVPMNQFVDAFKQLCDLANEKMKHSTIVYDKNWKCEKFDVYDKTKVVFTEGIKTYSEDCVDNYQRYYIADEATTNNNETYLKSCKFSNGKGLYEQDAILIPPACVDSNGLIDTDYIKKGL